MGRSYEERVSSYRKTFGPEGGQGRVQETREQVQYRYTYQGTADDTNCTLNSVHLFCF